MPVNNVNTLANSYTTETDSTIKDKSGLGIDDFFQIMAAQLQNQSMFDNVDNTQFITQMAQFSTLSQMTELVSTFKTNAAISLLGKNVSVLTSDENGQAAYVIGQVQQISFINGSPMVYVKDGFYELSAVTDITDQAIIGSEENAVVPETDEDITQSHEDTSEVPELKAEI
ncbi:MAG: flagellar hook assembly protein FlgD [Eubacteriales bacterium]